MLRELRRRLFKLLEQLGDTALELRIVAFNHRLGVVGDHDVRVDAMAFHRPFALCRRSCSSVSA